MADTGSTRQNLIAVVLENIGVLAAGQFPTAEDAACVGRRVDPTLATLSRREVFANLSADALDPGVFLLVADVVAYACRTPFGITGNKAAELKEKADLAEAELKAIARQYSATAATDAFDAVRHVLEQLGVVAPGQDPTAQDRGVVSARIAPMLADLAAREIINIADIKSAAPAQQRHLATILIASCAPAFGVTGDALAALITLAAAAERALKAMARQFDAGVATSGVFDPIQAALEMLGVVGAGQSASEKDRAVVEARIRPLLLELRGRDICGVVDLSLLGIELQKPFARLLAADLAFAFPDIPATRLAVLQSMVGPAEASLRYQSFLYDPLPPMRAERFWGRHHGRRPLGWHPGSC